MVLPGESRLHAFAAGFGLESVVISGTFAGGLHPHESAALFSTTLPIIAGMLRNTCRSHLARKVMDLAPIGASMLAYLSGVGPEVMDTVMVTAGMYALYSVGVGLDALATIDSPALNRTMHSYHIKP